MADNDGNLPAPVETPAQEDADFSAAFAERTGREEETPKDNEPDANEEQSASEAPAAEGKPTQGQGSEFDPWNGLSDEQKSYFEGLKQSESSQRGRVSALSRKINDMEKAATVPPAPKDQGEGDKEPKAKETKAERADRMRKAADEYPDAVGDLVEEVLEMRDRLENSQPKAPAESSPPDDAELEKEYAALEKAHPDYRTIGADPAYANWVGTKSEAIRALATSYAASDVSSVLSLYKAEREASLSSKGNAEEKTNTNAQKRERQLEGSKAVESRGSPTSSAPAADDFNSAFKARASRS